MSLFLKFKLKNSFKDFEFSTNSFIDCQNWELFIHNINSIINQIELPLSPFHNNSSVRNANNKIITIYNTQLKNKVNQNFGEVLINESLSNIKNQEAESLKIVDSQEIVKNPSLERARIPSVNLYPFKLNYESQVVMIPKIHIHLLEMSLNEIHSNSKEENDLYKKIILNNLSYLI